MESCLYIGQVMHHRLEPKRNKFSYDIFMFYIDLDELELIHKKLRLISLNAFNLFSFSNKHHANFPNQTTNKNQSVKAKILEFLEKNNAEISEIKRIKLITNFATVGYMFNPVSFYYCFNEQNEPVYAVAEVCNTFGEMKLYFLGKEKLSEDTFTLYTPKNFYVSPFSELDTSFEFILKTPNQKLLARVDDYKNDHRFLLSNLSGTKKELSDRNLVYCFLSIPFITLKVIVLIHWQAMRLYLKKLPFIKKTANAHLQQDLVKI